MSDLLRAAEQALRNDERLLMWRQRYYNRWGTYPTGSIFMHRLICAEEDHQQNNGVECEQS